MLWSTLILVEFICIGLMSCASMLVLTQTLCVIRRLHAANTFTPSHSLRVYLWTLLVCSLAVLVNAASMAAMWKPTGYNSREIFWFGVWAGELVAATPAAVLFLSLDRLFIICRPMRYGDRMKKLLGWLSVLTVTVLFTVNFTVALLNRDLSEQEDCWSFACLASPESLDVYAATRFIVAVPNFVCSVAFMVVLYRFRRKMEMYRRESRATETTERSKVGDHLALLVVIFELIFDLLPSAVNAILTYWFETNLSTLIGPYRQLTNAANALCCALAHVIVLRRIAKAKQTPQISALVSH